MTHVIACRTCDEQIDLMMSLILKYGDHSGSCDDTCTCGWSALQAAIMATDHEGLESEKKV